MLSILKAVSDLQPIIHVQITSDAKKRHNGFQAEELEYDVHGDFLCFYATSAQVQGSLQYNDRSNTFSTLRLQFPFPSAFGHYSQWLYIQKLPTTDLELGDWVALWIMAEFCGSPKLQNQVMRRLELLRAQGAEAYPTPTVWGIYNSTQRDNAIRRYLVDTWRMDLQDQKGYSLPNSLTQALFDSVAAKANGKLANTAFDIKNYLVDESAQSSDLNISDASPQNVQATPPRLRNSRILPPLRLEHPKGRKAPLAQQKKKSPKVNIKEEQID